MICYFYLTEEGKSEMTCTRLQNGIEYGGKGQLLQRDLGTCGNYCSLCHMFFFLNAFNRCLLMANIHKQKALTSYYTANILGRCWNMLAKR